MEKTKIAIAGQGGGSQTAFTAGVLKAQCDSRLRDEFEVVGVSGTSGGALCATLVWYSFRRGDQPLWQRLIDFWRDNTAQNEPERIINDAIIGWMRMVIGAASVLSGQLRKFNSTKEAIRIEHILAAAAVPNLFPAVQLDSDALWDGLFSDNPPIDLVRKRIIGAGNVPQEVWVIKINPTTRACAPVEPNEIADRRNQLEGNVSVFQNLKWIEALNDLILQGAFQPDFLADFDIPQPVRIPKAFAAEPDKPYHIPWIEMSEERTAGG